MAIPRFSGTSAWSALSLEEQAQIGATALELIVAIRAMQATEDPDRPEEPTSNPVNRAAHASSAMCITTIDRLATAALPVLMSFDDPPVPSIVGDVCEGCGCTDEDACDDGCAWLRPGRCTSCAPGRMSYRPPSDRRMQS